MAFQSSSRTLVLAPSFRQSVLTEKQFLRTAYVQTIRFSSSTAITKEQFDFVNAPTSTLPAPLVVPDSSESTNKFSHLFKTGKAYLGFYKEGIKNVYRNFMATRPLTKRQIEEGKGMLTKLVEDGKITRAEFQLVMRSRHDSSRIPMFALLFLICGEFTPFVVLAVPGITPLTCRIPNQINKMRQKLETRRRAAFELLPPGNVPDGTLLQPSQLNRNLTVHCSNVLGLHSSRWPSFLPPTVLLKRRVRKRMEYLNLDDQLLLKGGGVAALHSGEELKLAAVERGIDVLNKSEEQIRRDLSAYFSRREASGGLGAEMWFRRIEGGEAQRLRAPTAPETPLVEKVPEIKKVMEGVRKVEKPKARSAEAGRVKL